MRVKYQSTGKPDLSHWHYCGVSFLAIDVVFKPQNGQHMTGALSIASEFSSPFCKNLKMKSAGGIRGIDRIQYPVYNFQVFQSCIQLLFVFLSVDPSTKSRGKKGWSALSLRSASSQHQLRSFMPSDPQMAWGFVYAFPQWAVWASLQKPTALETDLGSTTIVLYYVLYLTPTSLQLEWSLWSKAAHADRMRDKFESPDGETQGTAQCCCSIMSLDQRFIFHQRWVSQLSS